VSPEESPSPTPIHPNHLEPQQPLSPSQGGAQGQPAPMELDPNQVVAVTDGELHPSLLPFSSLSLFIQFENYISLTLSLSLSACVALSFVCVEAFASKHLSDMGEEVEDFTVFTWNLSDYRRMDKKTTSPEFSCGGHKWYALILHLKPLDVVADG